MGLLLVVLAVFAVLAFRIGHDRSLPTWFAVLFVAFLTAMTWGACLVVFGSPGPGRVGDLLLLVAVPPGAYLIGLALRPAPPRLRRAPVPIQAASPKPQPQPKPDPDLVEDDPIEISSTWFRSSGDAFALARHQMEADGRVRPGRRVWEVSSAEEVPDRPAPRYEASSAPGPEEAPVSVVEAIHEPALPQPVLVDGSNVASWRGYPPDFETLRLVLRELAKESYEPIVIFDANIGWKALGREVDEAELAETIGLPAERVQKCPSDTRADLYLLKMARRRNMPIATRDGYKKHLKPDDRIWLIKGMVIDGEVILHEPVLAEPESRRARRRNRADA